jgi:hypothetical protein
MDILLALVVGALNVVCFYLGAKVGQKVVKGEEIVTPTVNPFKAYQEHKEHKEADRERQKLEAILRNIEHYDGTGTGQEDIPS